MTDVIWGSVLKTLPPEVLRPAVEAFHNETVRRVFALQGKVGAWAKKEVMDPGDGTVSLSDRFMVALGDEGSFARWRPLEAIKLAVTARRQSYVAELQAPQYDETSHEKAAEFFKRCRLRANGDMKRHLAAAGERAGVEVSFG